MLILAALLAIAGGIVYLGVRRSNAVLVGAGMAAGVATLVVFGLLDFWGEMLWFSALGYSGRFWTVVLAKAGAALGVALLGALFVFVLTLPIPKAGRMPRIAGTVIGAFIGLNWGLAQWGIVLRYLYGVTTGLRDPILGQDTGFYLFSLPFYDALYVLVLSLTAVSFIASFVALFLRIDQNEVSFSQPRRGQSPLASGYLALYLSAGLFLVTLGLGRFVDRYHLMYSTTGVVTGPGWTDVHVRLPVYWVLLVVSLALGVFMLVRPARVRAERALARRVGIQEHQAHLPTLGIVAGALVVFWFLGLGVLPGLVQWLRVEPNEITLEEPYIAHNIEFTRRGFDIHEVEEREYPVAGAFSRPMVEENRALFDNIRLWDWRALDSVYRQFQEIRLYYEFIDVDIDRYRVDGQYRQMMVSARELQVNNLPAQSQTFVNRHFKYTHGYGITLTDVSDFTEAGLPNLLVKDIPPQSTHPDLEVTRPEIYYGELTDDYVVANSEETEFDFPSGDQNVYTHYEGTGGVEIRNLWRKFIYGWKFSGTRFLLSGYPRPESRIMFRRNIRERVRTLAPFLHYDNDPYVVLADGELYWIIDAYTTSGYWPYGEPFYSGRMTPYRRQQQERALFEQQQTSLSGVNYIRNSVKVVVDAYDGDVDFYVFEPEDPLVRTWRNIFPGLFKDREDMPEALRDHVRYPVDMLEAQGLVYAKYHMTDPVVFYNQEDLWVRATEKYYDRVQAVEPYYIMWEPPGSDELEFVLMQPYTPKNRQVMIGWIAGMCDDENYGRFLAYKFPKEKRVLGPQQVETKIDQDRFLSGQLTLWDQQGSSVIRGNLLAIPVAETMVYVEPIYLQAETAAYPELRLVVVMHGDNLSYANSFEEALMGLFDGAAPELPEGGALPGAPSEAAATPRTETPGTQAELVRRANDAFERYLGRMGTNEFDAAGEALGDLQDALQQLMDATAVPETPPEELPADTAEPAS